MHHDFVLWKCWKAPILWDRNVEISSKVTHRWLYCGKFYQNYRFLKIYQKSYFQYAVPKNGTECTMILFVKILEKPYIFTLLFCLNTNICSLVAILPQNVCIRMLYQEMVQNVPLFFFFVFFLLRMLNFYQKLLIGGCNVSK